ncbi:hemolymph juvenile hormone binding protein (JHBP) [Popillia japonica]|uniref:Hemolymph juvenile hormone binding protein (JHBP) n=1 Tax=Popillia japonica TaxID=7064 RepID=A0AAW1IC07_POPJA
MLKYIILTCVLVNLYSCGSNEKKLPYFLKVCHRNDNDLNECVKRSIENLRPLMSKGIPEFDIPSCEPLIIPEVIIDQGNGPVSVKSTYNDVRVYGPTQFELKSIKIDLDKDKVSLKVWLPRLELNCQYSMEGRVLMLPISGCHVWN